MDRKEAVSFPARYRAEFLSAMETVDLAPVSRAIDVLLEARALNRRVFVCSSGASALAGSQLLCDLVRSVTSNRSERFRILAVTDSFPNRRPESEGSAQDRLFVEQLTNVAEYSDVIMGISSSGNPASLLRALEYATCVGCTTIAVTGRDGQKLAALADISILLPASHPASVEDSLMIICRMIGHSFVHAERG